MGEGAVPAQCGLFLFLFTFIFVVRMIIEIHVVKSMLNAVKIYVCCAVNICKKKTNPNIFTGGVGGDR